MINQFIAVSTKFICSFKSSLPFDVYLERAEGKYTNIYKKNSTHDIEQLIRYELQNVKTLFINRSEKHNFEEFIQNLSIDENLPTENIIEIMKAGLEFSLEHLDVENDEVNINIDLAVHNVKNSLNMLENDVMLTVNIFKAMASNSHLLKHSYMVSIFSILLAKLNGITSERTLLSVGLGAFLHDVGHTRIDPKITTNEVLSHSEWEELKDHPQLGLKIIDHSKSVSSDVRSIIIQHHEQHNGRGYPNRLPHYSIFPLAKIVAIADGFCSLISKTSYRTTYKKPLEALEIMNSDIGHYDPIFLKSFTEMMTKKKSR